MLGETLLLEMLSDRDVAFALLATGVREDPRLDATVAAVRGDPEILEALLDDHRVFAAVTADPEILVKVTPFFHFSVLLRRARRELHERTYTAEWLAPRRRVPVFDARVVAAVLDDQGRLHYLADLLASFVSVRQAAGQPRRGARGRAFGDLDLDALRRLREEADAADRFALDRRLGDVALFLAGIFPDSARGAVELAAWEAESMLHYRQAAREPLARQCGLQAVLDALAGELHPARKALNFVADRFLHPLRYNWFAANARA
jgi:hypothetical protein